MITYTNVYFILVELFVTRDAGDISNLLSFIGRHILRDGETNEGEDNCKIMKILSGEEEERRFYLVKTKTLEDKFGNQRSLLQYLVDNGARMMKQREELLDLLAEKIERKNLFDGKATENQIIKMLKLGLPSSAGLAECIHLTEEKFEWTSIKAGGMIAWSAALFWPSCFLYVYDVYTDGKFVNEMLEKSQTICTVEVDNKTSCRPLGLRFDDPLKYTQNAFISLAHIILPIITMILVWFCSICSLKVKSKIKILQKMPWLPITRFVKLILEAKKFVVRSQTNFQGEVERREAEITEYEDTVNLASSIEATTESSPQFFFQAVYLLPILVTFWSQEKNWEWEELDVSSSYKVVSVVFSFTSVAISNHFIR